MCISYFGVGYNGYISLYDWNGVAPDKEFVGIGNYADMMRDPIFWSSLAHVAVFGVITVVVQMILGFLIALILSGPIRGRGIYKAVVFIPVVLAPAAISTAFRQFLAADGQVNETLELFGLSALEHSWIADPQTALYALAAVNIFQWTGFSFILYQAALSQLDLNTLEAAQIDGAGTLRTIWSVILPQMRFTHFTLAITGAIGSLKTFDIVFLITGGGPGRASEFLTTYIYKMGIMQFHVGYAGALSIVLLLVAMIMTLIQFKLYRFDEEV